MEIWNHKIHRILDSAATIDTLNTEDAFKLVAEEVPLEEIEKHPEDIVAQVIHFTASPRLSYFGVPFYFVFKKGETLGKAKLRLKAKLKTPDEEFKKWRFAKVSFSEPEFLDDDDVPANYEYGRGEYFGISHLHRKQKKHYWKEESLKINN